MPRDGQGGFHLNYQRAHAADRMAGAKSKPMGGGENPKMGAVAEAEPQEHGESVGHITIHKHADGGYHSETHDGQVTEHPHIGHALMHAAAHHEPDGKHMHAMSDGMGEHTTHHVGEDGQVQGPHVHPDAEALGEHLKQFFNEEGQEREGEGYPKHHGAEIDGEGLAGI